MGVLSDSIPILLAAAEGGSEGATTEAEWGIVAGVAALVAAGVLAFTYTTRTGIIARSATKESIRQPMFPLLLVVGLLILLVNTVLPFFSLGEDVKMLKDCGLATLLICGLLLAVWTSSTSISEEIEGRTAMTLLSKPINRRQFVVGKYVGIVNAVMLMLIPLAVCFLALVYYKVGYDAREASKQIPEYAERMAAVWQVVPGLVLIVFEIAVLAAVSVAISTRLPMILNLVICFAIFVVGHLTPVLVQTEAADPRLEYVQFMAQLIATVLPSLEVFNMQAAVATGSVVPPLYLGMSGLYCLAYSGAALLLGFILFEDRDLA